MPEATAVSARDARTTLVESAARARVAVSLKAVDGAWPLYGAVAVEPAMDIGAALAEGGAIAEPALLSRLGISLGDRVRVGRTELEIRGVILREPDNRRILQLRPAHDRLAATLDAAQVLVPGALAEFSWRLMLPPGTDAAAILARLEAEADARWQVRSLADVQPRVSRFTDRLATYLTLAGLTALLTGGVWASASRSTATSARAARPSRP